MNRSIGQIKMQRATVMRALEEVFQNLMLRMLYNKSKPVCTLPQKQIQCDTLNLGCLLQNFPHFCDSRALDGANDGTIMSIITTVQHIRTYGSELTFPQWGRSHNTADHGDCGLDKVLLPDVMAIVQSVKGLILPSNSLS